MNTAKSYILILLMISLGLSFTSCKSKTDRVDETIKTPTLNSSSGLNAQSEGGYSGGGGDVNAYNTEEFQTVFKEAVEYAKRQHRSVPFFLMFLKFDNKLSANFEGILHKALSVGEGKIGIIQNIEVKFDQLCSSSSRGKSHGSVNYSLDSTICLSSLGLELMSKNELKRKLLALIAHEYVHMLGIKDEQLANKYQYMIYNNHHILDGSHLEAPYRATLKHLYESVYYFFYRDCVQNNLCSTELSFSKLRQDDLAREKPRRVVLYHILEKIELKMQAMSGNYRHFYFSLMDSFVDSTTWPISDNFNYSDYYSFSELDVLKSYLAKNEEIDEDTLKSLSLALVRRVFQLNVINRISQLGLVSRTLFFNYCFRPTPFETKETSDLLESYFNEPGFGYSKMGSFLEDYGIKTVWYGNEVIHLPRNRMCSNQDLSIPAMQGKPKESVPEDAIPLKEWMLNYSLPYSPSEAATDNL